MLLIHDASAVDSIKRAVNTVVDSSQVLLSPINEQNPGVQYIFAAY